MATLNPKTTVMSLPIYRQQIEKLAKSLRSVEEALKQRIPVQPVPEEVTDPGQRLIIDELRTISSTLAIRTLAGNALEAYLADEMGSVGYAARIATRSPAQGQRGDAFDQAEEPMTAQPQQAAEAGANGTDVPF